jgi:hypothetical protein
MGNTKMKRAYGLPARLYGGGPGIDGGLAIQRILCTTINIIGVPFADDHLAEIEKSGGKIAMPKIALPGGMVCRLPGYRGKCLRNHEGGQFSTLIFEITASSARQNQIRRRAEHRETLNHPMVNIYRLTRNLICG